MKKDYTKLMNWAVVTMIDRSTQDDHRSKVNVAALFTNPATATDSFIPHLPNPEIKRYLLPAEQLERFEEFYNFIQDLNECYREKAIYRVKFWNAVFVQICDLYEVFSHNIFRCVKSFIHTFTALHTLII